ncbi:Uncharacterised protein [Mycobacteroides abscessus subsp. abscessus]|nr:Uncharacterised protein [Mycobacteroides abscessus subsp. abscessus]
MAFFSAPGIERLYSGLTNSSACAEAMASFSAWPSAGYSAS